MITVESPAQSPDQASAHEGFAPVQPKRSSAAAAAVVSALSMAAVSLGLAGWQLWGMPLPGGNPQSMRPRAELPVSAPVTTEPAPAVMIEPPRAVASPPPPAFSEEELAAMQAEADRVERALAAGRGKVEGASAAVSEAWKSWKNLRETAVTSVVAAKTADLQRDAAVAGIRSLQARYEELARETAEILKTPKPPREALSGFSPVAKPAKGQEYHFEVRGDRVSFIDLQQLLELVKKDVQIRMRLSGSPRGIQSEVGPVGDFGLAYEIGPMNDMLGGTGVGLKGWEIVPAREPRGETPERAAQPLSEFDRAIRRLSPTSATITMWVYPDGFGTFRILRDRLHGLGFMVAARPLPEGVPVRGSPMGSISAGQ